MCSVEKKEREFHRDMIKIIAGVNTISNKLFFISLPFPLCSYSFRGEIVKIKSIFNFSSVDLSINLFFYALVLNLRPGLHPSHKASEHTAR
jgi:hypothetical protein